MNKEIGEELKEASPSKALALIKSLLESDEASTMNVNNWLYLYEILYGKVGSSERNDLGHAEAAVAILSHLESVSSSNMNSFLVQELNLRARLIKIHGVGKELLDPKYIFSVVKRKLGSTDPEGIPKNWRDLDTRQEIAALRNVKNLLGPVSLLKDIGIENNFYNSWLSVRACLP